MIGNVKATRSPIGLDIGRRRIHAAQLRHGEKGARLSAALSLPRVEPGDSLSSRDARRLAESLRRRGFVGRHVVPAAPARAAFTSVLDLPASKPGVPVAQIARMEVARIHRHAPNDFQLAFWELPIPARGAAGTHVMAAACHHEHADPLLDALEDHGFAVDGLDIAGWAMARACRGALDDEAGVVAAVNLGRDAATFILLRDGVLIYERTLDGCCLDELIESIRAEHDLAEEPIEHLLLDLGFEIDQRGEAGEARLFGRVRPRIDAHVATITQELHLSMQYASHQYADAGVGKLLLTGEGAAMPGLDQRLAEALDTPTTVMRLGELVHCPDAFDVEARWTSLTIAAGLAQYPREAIR